MMRFDALTVLFFVEFTCIIIFMAIILFFRSRKNRLLYRKALREILSLKTLLSHGTKNEENRKETKSGEPTSKASPAVDEKFEELRKEKDRMTEKVAELNMELQGKVQRLEALEKKYAVLEKEYSVLYGKHFDSKAKLK